MDILTDRHIEGEGCITHQYFHIPMIAFRYTFDTIQTYSMILVFLLYRTIGVPMFFQNCWVTSIDNLNLR